MTERVLGIGMTDRGAVPQLCVAPRLTRLVAVALVFVVAVGCRLAHGHDPAIAWKRSEHRVATNGVVPREAELQIRIRSVRRIRDGQIRIVRGDSDMLPKESKYAPMLPTETETLVSWNISQDSEGRVFSRRMAKSGFIEVSIHARTGAKGLFSCRCTHVKFGRGYWSLAFKQGIPVPLLDGSGRSDEPEVDPDVILDVRIVDPFAGDVGGSRWEQGVSSIGWSREGSYAISAEVVPRDAELQIRVRSARIGAGRVEVVRGELDTMSGLLGPGPRRLRNTEPVGSLDFDNTTAADLTRKITKPGRLQIAVLRRGRDDVVFSCRCVGAKRARGYWTLEFSTQTLDIAPDGRRPKEPRPTPDVILDVKIVDPFADSTADTRNQAGRRGIQWSRVDHHVVSTDPIPRGVTLQVRVRSARRVPEGRIDVVREEFRRTAGTTIPLPPALTSTEQVASWRIRRDTVGEVHSETISGSGFLRISAMRAGKEDVMFSCRCSAIRPGPGFCTLEFSQRMLAASPNGPAKPDRRDRDPDLILDVKIIDPFATDDTE